MLLDVTRLRALREEVGDDGFVEVLDLFLVESDEVVERMCSPGAGDPSEADLHFLKGIALNLGFDDLADLCRRAERGAGFDPQALRAKYAGTRAALAAALEGV